MQHEECGKLFCLACIAQHGKEKPCPNCKVIGSKYYKDKRSECIGITMEQGIKAVPSWNSCLPTAVTIETP